MPIAGSSPARSAILETTLRGGLLFFICQRSPRWRGFWHGRTCTGQRDCPARGFLLQPAAFCGGPLRRGQPAFLLTQLAQRVLLDVPVPMRFQARPYLRRTAGHGRTSRSVWLPLWRAPRRTCHPSAWGIRGTNRGAWVLLAPFHLPSGIRKSHRRGGPTMASLDSLGNFNDTLRSYSHSIHRTLMFPGGREIPRSAQSCRR